MATNLAEQRTMSHLVRFDGYEADLGSLNILLGRKPVWVENPHRVVLFAIVEKHALFDYGSIPSLAGLPDVPSPAAPGSTVCAPVLRSRRAGRDPSRTVLPARIPRASAGGPRHRNGLPTGW